MVTTYSRPLASMWMVELKLLRPAVSVIHSTMSSTVS